MHRPGVSDTPPKGPGPGGPSGGFTPGAELGQKNDPYRDPQQTPLSIDVPESGKDNIILTIK